MEQLISVIVPVYKSEKYLKRCLESIINQTYKNLEIILIDDGSPDDSGRICDEYAKIDNRIKVIHKKNSGVSSSRNEGITVATGEYISFIDADDWIDLNMYEEMYKAILANDVDVVRCGFYKDDDNNSIEMPFVYENEKKLNLEIDRNELISLYTSGKMHAGICFMLIKKEYIEKIKNFDINISMGEDLIFAIELMCVIKSIYFLNKSFYHYYKNPNSATMSLELAERNLKDIVLLYSIIFSIIEKYNFMNDDIKKELASLCFYKIYVQLNLAIKFVKKKSLINIVIENEDIDEIIQNVDKKSLSYAKKRFINLLRNRKINSLYYFCIVHNFLVNIIEKIKQ